MSKIFYHFISQSFELVPVYRLFTVSTLKLGPSDMDTVQEFVVQDDERM